MTALVSVMMLSLKNIVDPEIPSFKEKPLSKYELMAMRYEDDDLLAEMEGWMDAALEKGSSIEPIDEFPDEFLFSVEPERADGRRRGGRGRRARNCHA